MNTIDLKTANRLNETAFRIARAHGHLPITCCVVDRGGHVVSAQREDNSSTFRFEIAYGNDTPVVLIDGIERFRREINEHELNIILQTVQMKKRQLRRRERGK